MTGGFTMLSFSSRGRVDFTASSPNRIVSWVCGTWHISARLLNSSSKMAGGTRRLRIIWEKKQINLRAHFVFSLQSGGFLKKMTIVKRNLTGGSIFFIIYVYIYYFIHVCMIIYDCYLKKRVFSHVEWACPEVCQQSLGAGV